MDAALPRRARPGTAQVSMWLRVAQGRAPGGGEAPAVTNKHTHSHTKSAKDKSTRTRCDVR